MPCPLGAGEPAAPASEQGSGRRGQAAASSLPFPAGSGIYASASPLRDRGRARPPGGSRPRPGDTPQPHRPQVHRRGSAGLAAEALPRGRCGAPTAALPVRLPQAQGPGSASSGKSGRPQPRPGRLAPERALPGGTSRPDTWKGGGGGIREGKAARGNGAPLTAHPLPRVSGHGKKRNSPPATHTRPHRGLAPTWHRQGPPTWQEAGTAAGFSPASPRSLAVLGGGGAEEEGVGSATNLRRPGTLPGQHAALVIHGRGGTGAAGQPGPCSPLPPQGPEAAVGSGRSGLRLPGRTGRRMGRGARQSRKPACLLPSLPPFGCLAPPSPLR